MRNDRNSKLPDDDPLGAFFSDEPAIVSQDDDPLGAFFSQDDPAASDPIDRSASEVVGDLWASYAGGANSLLKIGGDLYGLATGDMENFASQQGQAGQEYWNARKSDHLKLAEDTRAQRISDAKGTSVFGVDVPEEVHKAGTALWETISSPSLMTSFMFEQVPMLLPVAGVGRIAGVSAKALGAGKVAAGRFAQGGAVAVGGAMAGADAGSQAYDKLMEIPDKVWELNQGVHDLVESKGITFDEAKKEYALGLSRNAAIATAIVSGVTNFLPGARHLEKALSGVKLPGASRVANTVVGFLGESAQEGIEEGFSAFSSNIAASQVDNNIDWYEGVGEQAGMGAAAGIFGGMSGAVAPTETIEQRISKELEKTVDRTEFVASPEEVSLRAFDPRKKMADVVADLDSANTVDDAINIASDIMGEPVTITPEPDPEVANPFREQFQPLPTEPDTVDIPAQVDLTPQPIVDATEAYDKKKGPLDYPTSYEYQQSLGELTHDEKVEAGEYFNFKVGKATEKAKAQFPADSKFTLNGKTYKRDAMSPEWSEQHTAVVMRAKEEGGDHPTTFTMDDLKEAKPVDAKEAPISDEIDPLTARDLINPVQNDEPKIPTADKFLSDGWEDSPEMGYDNNAGSKREAQIKADTLNSNDDGFEYQVNSSIGHGRHFVERRAGEPSPQEEVDPLTTIKVAADSLESLRPQDVQRVVDTAMEIGINHLADVHKLIRTGSKEQKAALNDAIVDISDFIKKGENQYIDMQVRTAELKSVKSKTLKAIEDEYGDNLAGLQLSNDQKSLFVLFLPDASSPGKYRISNFTADGFIGHSTFNSYQEALDDAVSSGYRNMASGAIERLSETRDFKDGNEYASRIAELNSGKITWDEFFKQNEEKAIARAPTEKQQVTGMKVVEAPISEITMSEDVPQFKAGANAKGVVEPLGGKFERTGVAPIQIWVRKDGRKEVITGRHRLDLAARSGEDTIPAQYHYESEGFDAVQAAGLDALLNIREGQGKVKDYVEFIKGTNTTKEEADAQGILARQTGKRAFSIATQGSDALIATHRNDQISDEAATRIAEAAPGNEKLQAVGIKAMQEGKTIAMAENMVKAVRSMTDDTAQESIDLFGFDDSAIIEAEKLAKKAISKQSEIQKTLSAVQGASKNPALAKKEGVDVKNPEALKAKIADLKQQKQEWQNWHTNPKLTAELREDLGFTLKHESEADIQQREAAEQDASKEAEKEQKAANDKFDADKDVDDFLLSGSNSPSDLAAARGQEDIFAQPASKESDQPRAETVTAPSERARPAPKAKQETPSEQKTDTKPLNKIRLSEDMETESGDIVNVSRKADVIIAEIDSDIDAMKALKVCING